VDDATRDRLVRDAVLACTTSLPPGLRVLVVLAESEPDGATVYSYGSTLRAGEDVQILADLADALVRSEGS
jgi:hypothetical protein